MLYKGIYYLLRIFCNIKSKALSNSLRGCHKAVVFSATLGIESERLIQKHMRISAAKALCLEAIGNAQIEAVCDTFCDELKKENPSFSLVPRFSPGYGDLSLDFQRSLLTVLNASKNIGVSLNESLSMSPSKSVTAIIGLKQKN